MKPNSSRLLLCLLLLAALSAPVARAQTASLFSTVPLGDPAYEGLKKLEAAGLLAARVSDGPLTRYDVALRLIEARQKQKEIVLAQSDLNSLLSLDEGAGASTAVEGAPGTEAALSSLEGAYASEIAELQSDVRGLKEKSGALDEAQAKTKRKIAGIRNQSAVRVNGVGRVLADYNRETQPLSPDPLPASDVDTRGYLDLMPSGVLGRDLQWGFIARVGTALMPGDNDPGDTFLLRRVWAEYSPSFLTFTLGDFDESYTPLTLWNRSAQDLKVAPDLVDRIDRLALYENHLDRYPLVPLRGVKMSVEFDRPGSKILDRIEASSFVHMIKSGFGDGGYGKGFTDWSVGGKGALRSKLGLSVEAYGMLYDQQLDSDSVTVVYDFTSTSTWATRYLVGSVRPKLEREVWRGLAVGAQMEAAFAKYRADKYDATRVLEDYAYLGGPYLQKGKSCLKFQYLEVGPSFYSPYAQQRQWDVMQGMAASNDKTIVSAVTKQFPNIKTATLFPYLQTLGQPGGLYRFYNRSYDNVFPYGLATPNRRGLGLDLDIRALREGAFRLAASAYKAREIQRNLVVNDPLYTQVVPVEVPSNLELAMREFTYVNAGSCLAVGKLLGWKKPFEIGVNVRQEFTENALGTLKSRNIVPGLKLGLRNEIDLCVSGVLGRYQGWEYGYTLNPGDPDPNAEVVTNSSRYTYWYDPTDLGHYTPFYMDGKYQFIQASATVRFGVNSRLDLLGSVGESKVGDASVLTARTQEVEVIYEVQF